MIRNSLPCLLQLNNKVGLPLIIIKTFSPRNPRHHQFPLDTPTPRFYSRLDCVASVSFSSSGHLRNTPSPLPLSPHTQPVSRDNSLQDTGYTWDYGWLGSGCGLAPYGLRSSQYHPRSRWLCAFVCSRLLMDSIPPELYKIYGFFFYPPSPARVSSIYSLGWKIGGITFLCGTKRNLPCDCEELSQKRTKKSHDPNLCQFFLGLYHKPCRYIYPFPPSVCLADITSSPPDTIHHWIRAVMPSF